MIVVDASVLLDILLNIQEAGRLERAVFGGGEVAHAPHLIDLEIAHVLRAHTRRGVIEEQRGRTTLDVLMGLPLRRNPHTSLLPRIWDLRYNITAYDAAYVALAESLDATLVTRDRRLASASGHHARIELL